MPERRRRRGEKGEDNVYERIKQRVGDEGGGGCSGLLLQSRILAYRANRARLTTALPLPRKEYENWCITVLHWRPTNICCTCTALNSQTLQCGASFLTGVAVRSGRAGWPGARRGPCWQAWARATSELESRFARFFLSNLEVEDTVKIFFKSTLRQVPYGWQIGPSTNSTISPASRRT